MELFRSGRLCRLTLLLLALTGCLAVTAEAKRRARGRRRHRHGNGDILEQIDTEEVAKVLQSRHRQPAAPPPANDSLSPSERRETADRITPHLLKSSRRARLITKQRYLKKDWCKTEPLVRRLKEPGCRSRRVVDRFCYGQCNSFYIPREDRGGGGRRRGGGSAAFQSCAICQPRSWKTRLVMFRCPGKVPSRRRRRVKLVKECRCSAEGMRG